MIFRWWAGWRRRVGAVALASLVALVAAACGSSAAGSHPTARPSDPSSNGPTLSSEAARNVAVQTWVRHLASVVALDANSLSDSEAGFQLETDKLALPLASAEGKKENQYAPTGNVDWVALPSKKPQLVMLAHIKTTWQPQPSSSVQQSSEDDLVLFARQAVGQKWHLIAYPSFPSSSDASPSEVRQLTGAYPTRSTSSLPIPPSSLPEKYSTYVSGGASAPFSAGPLTDQRRSSLQQSISAESQEGVSMSLPFESGSVIGTYEVGGQGDGLVAFGTRYAELLTAPAGRCIVQSSTQPSLPTVVPAGKYAQVRLELGEVDLALENKSTGTVQILGDFSAIVGESTTPTTAPACL